MSLRALLEEFKLPAGEGAGQASATGPVSEADLEAMRSAAYEAGYSSGWEDAGKASEEQNSRIDAEFERCVQDLGFTFHEAVAQLRGEVGALMLAVTEQFIPEILPDLIRATMRDEILKIVEGALHPVVELVASPDTFKIFEDFAPASGPMEIRVRAEPSLGPNQAFLRFEDQEVVADFEPLLTILKEQLAAFTHDVALEVADG